MKEVEKIEIGQRLWSDDRGWGINPVEAIGIESKFIGNIHTVSIKPDKVRGNHYHTKSTEWILFFGGKAKLFWRIKNDKVTHEILVSESKPSLFKIPPNIEHAVINKDKHEIYLISINDSTDRGTVKSESLINLL